MKQTMIPVIFRKDKRDNEVVAFFPTMKSNLGFVTIYAHNGQHCEGRVEYFLEKTTPVSKEEYTPLLNELDRGEAVPDDVLVALLRKNGWHGELRQQMTVQI